MIGRIYFWDVILLVMFSFVSLLTPWAMIFWWWRVPTDVEIDPEFISGLIALSGILGGFITAIVATRPRLPSSILLMMLMNWGFFLYAATEVLKCAVGQSRPIYAVIYTMSSLISNHFIAGGLLVSYVFGRSQEVQ